MSMSPGTLLDGRYRLDVLLSEHDGARFWRATDTVLARSVAVHVVPSDDARAPAVLAAARASSAVTDPHFLRVLDCDDADGHTWVINEWGDGTSLDIMLARGTLPAVRAAWLAREVAVAMVAAHAQGLSHGRLNPEAVLVTESGAVKLIGFVVNAAFERSPATTSPYGPVSPREADVVDLAGILYAALTGKWPGVSPSAVPPAPRAGNRPLRPRQVRAGVPRTLDAICERVLNKEASQHALPIETALEIAAALSDFVGDPAAVAPVDVPSMHDEPPAPELDDTELFLVEPAPVETPPVETPPVAHVEPAPVEPAPVEAPPRPPARPATAAAVPEEPFDPDATMASPPPFSPSGIEYVEPEDWEPAAPPPPFEQPVERPLFAEDARRVPANAPTAAAATTPPVGSDAWPFEGTTSSVEPRRKRRGLTVLLAVLVVIAVAVAAYLAFLAGRDDDPDASPESPGGPTTAAPTASPSATQAVTGSPVVIAEAGDFDPEGDPPEENPGRVGLAVDGDPSTSWPTVRYTTANLGGLKSGVGLVLDLGLPTLVTSVEVALRGEPTDVEVYATAADATAPPAELADAARVGRVAGASGSAIVRLSDVRTRYVVVWLTRLPEVGGGFQGQVAEITVRS